MQKKVNFYVFMLSLSFGVSGISYAAINDLLAKSDPKLIAQEKSLPQKIATEALESSKIIAGSTFAAIAYGIGNDQITARICPEYFTEGFHKQMLSSASFWGDKKAEYMLTVKDPTTIGLYWGVMATWWFGAGLGVPAVAAARLGSWPKLDAKPTLISPQYYNFDILLGHLD